MQRWIVGILRSKTDPYIPVYLCQWIRGKKWRPTSEDTRYHENYGHYLKRWRRQKLRNIVQNEGFSVTSDDVPKLDRPTHRHEHNIDMFYSDSYHDAESGPSFREGSRFQRSRFKARTRKRSRLGSKSDGSSNQWTFRLRDDYEDEWDWDELHSTYGDGETSEEDSDLDDAFEGMKYAERRSSSEDKDKKYRSSKSNEERFSNSSHLSKECVDNLRVLGLPANGSVTAKDLKEAFHKCALRWHPDRHEKDQKALAASKFRQVQEAYKALQAHVR